MVSKGIVSRTVWKTQGLKKRGQLQVSHVRNLEREVMCKIGSFPSRMVWKGQPKRVIVPYAKGVIALL